MPSHVLDAGGLKETWRAGTAAAPAPRGVGRCFGLQDAFQHQIEEKTKTDYNPASFCSALGI